MGLLPKKSWELYLPTKKITNVMRKLPSQSRSIPRHLTTQDGQWNFHEGGKSAGRSVASNHFSAPLPRARLCSRLRGLCKHAGRVRNEYSEHDSVADGLVHVWHRL